MQNFTGWSAVEQSDMINTSIAIWSLSTVFLVGLLQDIEWSTVTRMRKHPQGFGVLLIQLTLTVSGIKHRTADWSWLPYLKQGWKPLVRALGSTISVTLFVVYGYQAWLFKKYLDLNFVEMNDWKFGQIVAVTVWAPPVVEFLRLLFSEALLTLQSRSNN